MASFLDWRNPELDSENSPYYLSLRRQTDPNLSAPGEPVPVTIEGSDPGELHEGIRSGEVAISWVIPNVSACSTVVLELEGPDMSRGRAVREIVLVAKSLRSAG
jgi:hypothetical protein